VVSPLAVSMPTTESNEIPVKDPQASSKSFSSVLPACLENSNWGRSFPSKRTRGSAAIKRLCVGSVNSMGSPGLAVGSAVVLSETKREKIASKPSSRLGCFILVPNRM